MASAISISSIRTSAKRSPFSLILSRTFLIKSRISIPDLTSFHYNGYNIEAAGISIQENTTNHMAA